jgi:GDP-4-dehydro-6-deoxy-D-mannose reductase
VIFHLAALLRSDDPSAFYTVNAGGTAILFESICLSGLRPRVVVLSSSAVYGPSAGEKPIDETASTRPDSHYALSKLAQEWIAAHFRDEFGLPVLICRPFNLSGPGLPVALALSSFARQIACAEASGRDALRVGRLDRRRDFVDVRDAVVAYLAVAETGEPGAVYNVCTGISRSMAACLDIMLRHARTEILVEQDPGRSQLGDVDNQIGDPGRLKRATGWEPVIPLEQSLLDMLEYWRLRDDACS